jgi:hypothetical protein
VEESSRSSNTSGKPPQLVRALALPSASTRSYPRDSKPVGMPYGGGWCGFRYTQRRLNSPVLGCDQETYFAYTSESDDVNVPVAIKNGCIFGDLAVSKVPIMTNNPAPAT